MCEPNRRPSRILTKGLITVARHHRNGSRRTTTFFPQFSPVKTHRRNTSADEEEEEDDEEEEVGEAGERDGGGRGSVGCLRGLVEKVEKGRRREGEINKKREKREGRKKGGTSRGAEKTKRNCGLAAVDDLGGEGRGSRPGSGMLDPLLLLLEHPLSSRGLPVSLFLSVFSLLLPPVRSRVLLHTRTLCLSTFSSTVVVVKEKKEEGEGGKGGGGGRKDDKRQG